MVVHSLGPPLLFSFKHGAASMKLEVGRPSIDPVLSTNCSIIFCYIVNIFYSSNESP